jgi:CBS domain-containing protein
MSDTLVVMSEKSFGIAGVIEDGCLIGVISDGDLRRNMAHLMERTAGEVATRAPRVVAPDSLAAEALAVMSANKITALFVTEGDGASRWYPAPPRLPARRPGLISDLKCCGPVPLRGRGRLAVTGRMGVWIGSVVVVCQAQLLEDVGCMGRGAGEDRDGVLVHPVACAFERGVEVRDGCTDGVSPIEETVVPRTGPLGPTEMRSSELSALWLKWSMAKSVLSAAMAGAAKDAARAAAARVMESFMFGSPFRSCVSGVRPGVSGLVCQAVVPFDD